MKTLNDICIECGADKASTHPVRGHDYCRAYARHFAEVRELPLRVMEIGVGGGESVRAWLQYFTKAKVLGVDINATNPWTDPHGSPDPRYTFVQGDQSKREFWRDFVRDHGSSWNIIIDDGGHFSDQVIVSFECLWPHVQPGGLYCIEDLGVDSANSIFIVNGLHHMEFIKSLMQDMNRGLNGIAALHYYPELAIFQKS